MEQSPLDSCLPGGIALPCRSPLSQWATPPAAHTHHTSSSTHHPPNPAHHPPSTASLLGSNPYLGLFGQLAPDHDISNAGTFLHDRNNGNSGNNCGNSALDVMSLPQAGGETSCSTSNPGSGNRKEGEMGGDRGKSSNGQRQNTVGTIMLHGEGIVSLVIDDKVTWQLNIS